LFKFADQPAMVPRALALAGALACARGALFSNVFGANMALQRDAPVPAWGWTSPGAAVRATLGAEAQAAVADADGLWRVTFAPRAAWTSATLAATVAATGETQALANVVFGDVVLCSGQSNMEFTTNAAANASIEVAAADKYPFIRVTSGPLQGKLSLRDLGPDPYRERVAVDLPWAVADNRSIGGVGDSGGWDYFSAACWFTLKSLADANAAAGAPVPLGGIVESYGGTSIQWWSSPAALAACPAAAANPGSACCNYGGNNSCLFNAQIAPYTVGPTRLAAVLWCETLRRALRWGSTGRPVSARPHAPPSPASFSRLIDIDQGEQNAGCGGVPQIDYYKCALPALIADWRARFASPALPFGLFQLAAWSATTDAFPLLRLAQVATAAADARAFTASTLDAGDPAGGPVHSPCKQLPAARAARALGALLYARAEQYVGPRAAVAAPRGAGAVEVAFTAASLGGGALALDAAVACPAALPAAACEAFAVQTADCVWHAAAPALGAGGATLVLSLPGAGEQIVAVRGLFGNWPLVQVRSALPPFLPADPWLLNVTGVAHACPPPSARAEAWVDSGAHA